MQIFKNKYMNSKKKLKNKNIMQTDLKKDIYIFSYTNNT